MSYQGVKASWGFEEEHARGSAHAPVIVGKEALADQGEYPCGLIVSLNTAGKIIPYDETADETLATGDGTEKTLTGTITNLPVEPGSVVIADDVETFTDNGLGVLTGSEGGNGTVNYVSGAVSVTFDAAVTNAEDVSLDYVRKPYGVLDRFIDTDDETACTVIIHGSYLSAGAVFGASAQTAITTAQMNKLTDIGLFAE